MIGRTLSHYVLEAPLGKGGMGEVYSARDSRLGRAVAIKVLPENAAQSNEGLQRFLTEAKAASALNHPNIVTVHDIDHSDGVHFIVMEKIDGVALSSLTDAMPVGRFLEVALQITSALGAAHEAGIVHRDIKPANIMLTPSGSVKVVDFGLARLTTPDTPVSADEATAKWVEGATKPGMLVGTLGYMSPEQLEGRRADTRSDVFSLGVMFYALLTGRTPFPITPPLVAMAAILRDEPPRIDELRPDVPKNVADVVHRCLEKDPANRFSNASELHAALRTLQERPAHSTSRRGRMLAVVAAVVVIAAIAAATLWWRRESRLRWAREVAPREVERLIDEHDSAAAYVIAREAMSVAPDDTVVKQTWSNITFPVTLLSEPPGVKVEIRSYRKTRGAWITLGRTPIAQCRMPSTGPARLRLTLDGYATREITPEFMSDSATFRMRRAADVRPGMVPVDGGPSRFSGKTAVVPDFWIDRHEVTNADFKRFVDAGGYRRRELWKHGFEEDGKPVSWEAAMARFVDRTGRPGPASWELGSFVEGKADHPVEAISWYEAAAFAEFAGKSLPTVFHWNRAAPRRGPFSDILAMSNFASKSTVPVESMDGLGAWGTYDMAGNVEEWCVNAVGSKRYILGGGWTGPAYQYNGLGAADPMERRDGVGMRLIQQDGPVMAELAMPVEQPEPVPVQPVDDATFAVYQRLYDYDAIPLEGKVEEVDDSHDAWRKERVSYTTAYGERMSAYLFLPKNARPPYQAIVLFPGSDAVISHSSRSLWLRMIEFYMRSGRALIYPVYQGTYERQVPAPRGLNGWRDLQIARTKDVRRSVDYLFSRPDIDHERIGFYGISLGGLMAPFSLATEPRFKVAIVLAGGLLGLPSLPEATQENFLPRVKVPTMLLGGRYDFTFPPETSQRRYFDLIGTPPDRKKYVLFDGGHVPVRFNDAVKEMLAWTDRWMGEVQAAP